MTHRNSPLLYQVSQDVRGLIFDFDGTLVDSMPAHFASWCAAFADFGHVFDEAFFYRHAGVTLPGVVALYNQTYSAALDCQAVVNRKNELHLQHIPSTRPIEPVMCIVRHHHGRLPMAVASGNTRAGIEKVMERLGMSRYFDCIVCGDDVERAKPFPDCFIRAAAHLDVPPHLCEVFEDAEPGLEGARRAGMKATDIRPLLSRTR